VSARVHGWNDRAELVEVYEQGRKQFFDDGGWQDPEVRRHECGLLAVANYVAHQPSERAEAPRSDECCMDCYGPCQAAKPQSNERGSG